MVEHGARKQHDVPAVAVLVHGGQNEHHRQERHGQAAGGPEFELFDPAGQLPPGEKIEQLAQGHQCTDRHVEHIGQLRVHGKDQLMAIIPADGHGNGLHVEDGKVQRQRDELAAERPELFLHLILPC